MKEFIIKWSVVLIVAAALYYVVAPKYDFKAFGGNVGVHAIARCNKITGHVDGLVYNVEHKRYEAWGKE